MNQLLRVTVHTLTCHDHVPMARRCLGSMLAYSADPIHLVIHDDGTLTQADMETLEAELPGCSFIGRREADERMVGYLARTPAARLFRERSAVGIKMLDLFYMEPGDDVAFCDSDVLFFHPFRDLFRLSDPAVGMITMRDNLQSYAVYPWHVGRLRQLRLAAGVNCGMLAFRRSSYDPELVEWFCSLPDLGAHNQWIEQTCWGMLASRANAWQWDPRQVRIIAGRNDLRQDPVAGHFVTPFRRYLPWREEVRSLRDPVRVNRIPAGPCRPLSLLRDEFLRTSGRLRTALNPRRREGSKEANVVRA